MQPVIYILNYEKKTTVLLYTSISKEYAFERILVNYFISFSLVESEKVKKMLKRPLTSV